MQEGNKTTVSPEITLYLNEDSLEFANEYRAREVLERYCSFMPVEIFLSKANAEPEYDTIDEADVLDTDTVVEHITEEPKEGEEGEPKQKAKIVRRPVSISDTHPLWTKNPSECTKDDYIDFYRKVFMDYKEPLFWIHLNMDYPFNLKGILYFPKINTEYDSIEGKIKLYNNQVFIADNIKEVIPEFLMVLKGVIDCPDAAKTEEAKAEETKTDAEESKDADAKEEEKTRIFYVTDEVQQSQYINMFKAQGQDAIILTHNIDSAFITYLEQKHQEVQFLRIDADVHDSLKDEVAEDEKEEFQKTTDSLVEIFRKELGNEKLDVKVEKLKDENVASMAVLSEENRRMQEMMKMYGMGGMDASMFGSQATLVLNANHPLVQFLVTNKDSENVSIICKQLYDLAMLAHKPLSPEEMTAFVKRSNDIMMLLTK